MSSILHIDSPWNSTLSFSDNGDVSVFAGGGAI